MYVYQHTVLYIWNRYNFYLSIIPQQGWEKKEEHRDACTYTQKVLEELAFLILPFWKGTGEKCMNFHTHQQTETLNQTQLWAVSCLCTHAELTSWRSKTRKPRIPILSSDARTALPCFPSQLFVLFCFVLFRPPTFYFEKTFRMTGRISSIV